MKRFNTNQIGKTQKMSSMSSLINGLIAGAGIVLALMSFGFLQYVSVLKNLPEGTITNLQISIFLGGIIAVVAIAYEFYSKRTK